MIKNMRFIERYEPTFPLLGTQVNKCLDEFEEALTRGQRGLVFYIEGEGGTGKSEILRQMELAIRRREVERIKAPLFGGIIDLYDYSSYYGIGIEQMLIGNWSNYFSSRESEFIAHRVYAIGDNRPAVLFNEYKEAYSKFARFRFATPNIEGVEILVNKRRQGMAELFYRNLGNLADFYLPIICLDTAELLEYDESMTAPRNATLVWLENFLQTPQSQECIVIIAGRQKNERGEPIKISQLAADGTPEMLTLGEVLSRTRSTTPEKFKSFALDRLNEEEIKAYLFWYDNYYNQELNSNSIESNIVTIDDLIRTAQASWPEITMRLKNSDVFYNNENMTNEVVYRVINELTEGKPLLVDWLCQIVYRQSQAKLPGLNEDGTTDQIAFKNELSRIIGYGASFMIDTQGLDGDPADLQNKIIQILLYACIARKGLDAATIRVLANDGGSELNETIANQLIDLLEKNAFIKVRSRLTQSTNGESSNPATQKMIFLHDEVYLSLSTNLENIQGRETVAEITNTLARTYSIDAYYARSVRAIGKQLEEVRQINPELIGQPRRLEEKNWFDEGGIDRYLVLEPQIQDRLVERLYYRLKADFISGYDEYCIVSNMAIAEQEIGLDTRLHKELMRYERSLQPSDFKRGHSRETYETFRRVESQIQFIKRRIRDNASKGVKETAIIEFRQIAQTIAAQGDSALPRLKLCQADALVSIYDYGLTNAEFEVAEKDLLTAVDLAKSIERPATTYEPGAVRDYVFWQKHLLLGRTYHTLGRIYQRQRNLDDAIKHYQLAIENFKHAESRVEVYLNDSRINLAYVYRLRGKQTLAEKICTIALQSQLRYGHKAYIALAQNMLAQILVESDETMAQSYTLIQQALELLRQDIEPAELVVFSPYWLLEFYNGQITRRVARHYATSFERAVELHEAAIETLQKVVRYYRTLGATTELGALNEIGCAYRSLGRTFQVQLDKGVSSDEQTLLITKRNEAFNEADRLLREVNTRCESDFYLRFENSLDMLHLLTYRHNYEQAVSFEQVQQNFVDFEVLMDETLKESNDPGQQLVYPLFKGKIISRRAAWYWKLYLSSGRLETEWLNLYISDQILALDWFVTFQPSVFKSNNENVEFSRDSLYINRIEADIGRTLRDHNERQATISYVQSSLNKGEITKTPGLLIFCHMLDIMENINTF
jgi:tetratricopeptide (TPR) repeat protein